MQRVQRMERLEKVLFLLFVDVGGNLRSLHRHLNDAGFAIGYRTLARYCGKYSWRHRFRIVQTQAESLTDYAAMQDLRRLLDRQGQTARTMTAAGLSILQDLMQDRSRLQRVNPQAIARFVDLGTRIERASLGDQVAIDAAIRHTVKYLVLRVGNLFNEANGHDDPEVRKSIFGPGADAILNEFLSERGIDMEDAQ